MQRGSSLLRQGLTQSRLPVLNARSARSMHSRHIGISGVAPSPAQSHVVGDTREPLIVTTIGRCVLLVTRDTHTHAHPTISPTPPHVMQ